MHFPPYFYVRTGGKYFATPGALTLPLTQLLCSLWEWCKSFDQQGAVTWQPVSRELHSTVNNSTLLVPFATDGTLKCRAISFCINQLHLMEMWRELTRNAHFHNWMPHCCSSVALRQQVLNLLARRCSFTLCGVRNVDRQLPAEGVDAHHAVGGGVS